MDDGGADGDVGHDDGRDDTSAGGKGDTGVGHADGELLAGECWDDHAVGEVAGEDSALDDVQGEDLHAGVRVSPGVATQHLRWTTLNALGGERKGIAGHGAWSRRNRRWQHGRIWGDRWRTPVRSSGAARRALSVSSSMAPKAGLLGASTVSATEGSLRASSMPAACNAWKNQLDASMREMVRRMGTRMQSETRGREGERGQEWGQGVSVLHVVRGLTTTAVPRVERSGVAATASRREVEQVMSMSMSMSISP